MKCILLSIEHRQNRQVLSQALEKNYQILAPNIEDGSELVRKQILKADFDLCFVDYGAIHKLRETMLAARKAAIPTYLPFVFLTSLQDVGLSTDHLEELIDDIIYLPIKKIELQTKIRILLRSRSYSLQLQATQERLNQSLTREQELNQIKSGFVSTVSHELRNPLNSISGMAQILEAYGDKLNPEKKAEVLQQLRQNVTKMTKLIDDMLVITKKDLNKLQFNPQPLDLKAFCISLIREVETGFNHNQTIKLDYQAPQPEYSLDAKLLDHILSNLLSNACKYSPKDSEINCKIYCQDDRIVFVIRDRGIGIPSQDVPYLFDSFYRASNSKGYQGTGLGLAIAKEYVGFHQGTISVTSELEIGTVFTVMIPINRI